MTSHQTLRIVDASLNRVGEGLRFLEDIARLMLDDTELTQKLKNLRHELIAGEPTFHQQLLRWRDAEGDVGKDVEVPGETKGREISSLLVANSRRVQEALRTLEELAKVPSMSPVLDREKFKQARFNLYGIERELMSRLMRQDKLKKLSGLYVIIDMQVLAGRRPLKMAEQAIRGGATTIQLRDKLLSKDKLLLTAQELKNLCAAHSVLFIVNDYLDVALAVDADGLHVGQEDLPAKVARELLPLDKLLGVSATTVEQAALAQAEGADYVAVGAIYPTPTKGAAKAVGLEILRQVRQAVSVPVVAIGGINQDNAADVIAAGADSVAVISAVLSAVSPEAAARQIAEKFETRA